MKKLLFLFLIGFVFIDYSKGDVNLSTIQIDTKYKKTHNLMLQTQWTYHKDTPNYIYDDNDFCNLFFIVIPMFG